MALTDAMAWKMDAVETVRARRQEEALPVPEPKAEQAETEKKAPCKEGDRFNSAQAAQRCVDQLDRDKYVAGCDVYDGPGHRTYVTCSVWRNHKKFSAGAK